MPADRAIGLRTHGKQVHLAEAVFDAANGKVAISIEPLLNETFSEQCHKARRSPTYK